MYYGYKTTNKTAPQIILSNKLGTHHYLHIKQESKTLSHL